MITEHILSIKETLLRAKYGEELWAVIEEFANSLGAEESDIAEALHWFCSDNYNGMGDPLYEVICRLKFNPGRMSNGPEEDSIAWELHYCLCDEYEYTGMKANLD